jgi:adenylate cyclase
VIVLAIAAVVVVVVLAMPFVGHTLVGPVLDRRRRARDDTMLFEYYCGHGVLHRFMRVNRRLPADPRGKLCYAPFGRVGRILGIRPSRKNSNFCRACFESVPDRGHEREIGVLFADLRGFTSWSEQRSPEQVADSLRDYYKLFS